MAGGTIYGSKRSLSLDDGKLETEKSLACDKSTIDTLMRMLQRLKNNDCRADVTGLWDEDMLSTYAWQNFTSTWLF
jgi:hypothetical protein